MTSGTRFSPAAIAAIALVALTTGCTSGQADDASATPSSMAGYADAYADWAPRYVECARGFGADARITPNGDIQSPVAAGREMRDGLDAECVGTVGTPPAAPPPTASFLRGLHSLLIAQAECLTTNGYTISESPSSDEWVENYDGTSWNPLMDVHATGDDVTRAMALCPQPSERDAEALGATLDRA
ncbi:MAG: hypothetical protein H7146_13860 [Burkholderiaceae bacterium]|nr:hypothetical protein [Microbacteriaceae bacterium]